MFNYIGGESVNANDASEGMADIPQNRTLFIQQLTQDEPVNPEAVYDLKTVQEVFDHFKPNVDVEFTDANGAPRQENLQFSNLGDFSAKKLSEQSPFLMDLSVQQEQYEKVVKQLKTNKLIQRVMESPELKSAFLNALQALYQELDENKG
jgi:hypothetical protein